MSEMNLRILLDILNSRALDQVNLRKQIDDLKEEKSYLLNSLLDPYTRSFETRLHIAESKRYRT